MSISETEIFPKSAPLLASCWLHAATKCICTWVSVFFIKGAIDGDKSGWGRGKEYESVWM